MGELTDKAGGRAKQTAGALTGDDETKRAGERQERKGEAKGHVNDATAKVKAGIDRIKDRVSRA